MRNEQTCRGNGSGSGSSNSQRQSINANNLLLECVCKITFECVKKLYVIFDLISDATGHGILEIRESMNCAEATDC